ncbi:MAG: hypothetical protein U0528_11505 [Anaerolineae bacterium]
MTDLTYRLRSLPRHVLLILFCSIWFAARYRLVGDFCPVHFRTSMSLAGGTSLLLRAARRGTQYCAGCRGKRHDDPHC